VATEAAIREALQQTVNGALADAMIGHQVGLLRHSNAISAEIVKVLEDSRGQLEDLLRSRLARALPLGYDPGPVVSARAAVQLEAIRKYVDGVVQNIDDHLISALEGVGEWEVGFQERLLSGLVPLSVNYSTPSSNTLKSLVTELPYGGENAKFYGEHISDFAASQFASVAQTIQRGVIAGETVDQITSNVIGTKGFKFSDGAWTSRKRRYEAETLVRTSVNHVTTASREELYKANDDIVKSIQIVATLDGRTTLICQTEDGEVYPVGSGPRPPFHYSCRTTTAPVLKSYGELVPELRGKVRRTPRERAMLDGTTSGKVTYNRWLRRQNAEMQNFVLGRYRGRLYRTNPDISIHKFADPQGRMMSLSQLVAQDARLFLTLSDAEIVKLDQWLERGQMQRLLTMKAKKEGRLPKPKPKPTPEQEFFKARDATFGELREGDVLKMGSNRARITSNVIEDDKAHITYEMRKTDGTISVREMTQPAGKKAPSQVMPQADLRPSYKARQMSRAEAIEVFEREIPENAHVGWFRREDIAYKRTITEAMDESQDARDAALNIMHRQVEDLLGKEVPFDEFLNTEYTLYRGGKLSGSDARNTFQSFSLDKRTAQKFIDKNGGDLFEIKLKPSQTYGSGQTIAEAEVMIPTNTAMRARIVGEAIDRKPDVPKVIPRQRTNERVRAAKKWAKDNDGPILQTTETKTARALAEATDDWNEKLTLRGDLPDQNIDPRTGLPFSDEYIAWRANQHSTFAQIKRQLIGKDAGIKEIDPERLAVLQEALNANWNNPVFRQILDSDELPEQIYVSLKKAMTRFDLVDGDGPAGDIAGIGTSFFHDVENFLDLVETLTSDQPFAPGVDTVANTWSRVLRARLGYRLQRMMNNEYEEAGGIRQVLLANKGRVAADLSKKADADFADAFAELFTIITDPNYKRADWPDWVNEAGDRMVDALNHRLKMRLVVSEPSPDSEAAEDFFNKMIANLAKQRDGEMPQVPEFQDVRELERWALDHIIDKDVLAEARVERARILALSDNDKIDEFGSVAKALEEADEAVRLVKLEGLGDMARELVEEIVGAQHRFKLPLLRELTDGKDVDWPTRGSLFGFNYRKMSIDWNKSLFDRMAAKGESVESIVLKAFNRGYLSEGNLREVFQHEMMHYIQHYASEEIRDAMDNVIAVAQRGATGQMSQNQFRVLYFRSISGYASEDDMMFNWNEVVTELYAAVYRKGLNGVVPESPLAGDEWRESMKDAILTLYRTMGMSDPPDVPGPDPMVPRFYQAAIPEADKKPDVPTALQIDHNNPKVKELLQIVEDGGKIDDDALYLALSDADKARVAQYVERAAGNEDEYKAIIDAVAKQFKMTDGDFADPEPETYFYGPLKKAERVAAKALGDYDGDLSQVGDVLRMTYVVDDPADAAKVLRALEELDAPEGVKNRMIEPGPGGYRDVIFKLVLKDGMKAEVQINNRPMLLAKNGPGHKLYEAMRVLDKGTPEYKRLAKESELLYGRAWLRTCKIHPTFPGCPQKIKPLDKAVPGGRSTFAHEVKISRTLANGDVEDILPDLPGSTDATLSDVEKAMAWIKETTDIDLDEYATRLLSEADIDLDVTGIMTTYHQHKSGGDSISFVLYAQDSANPNVKFHWAIRFGHDTDGKLHVHHTSIEIHPELRGLGKKMMWAAFDAYDEMGADEVSLFAVDVGSYAWGRYGFKMKQDEWDDYRRYLTRWLYGPESDIEGERGLGHFVPHNNREMRAFFEGLPEELRESVIEILEDADPAAFHRLVDLETRVKIKLATLNDEAAVVARPKVEMPLGRALTMRTEWSGSIDLKDDAQMVRFWRYVGDEERTFEAKKRMKEPPRENVISPEKAALELVKKVEDGEDIEPDAVFLSLSEPEKQKVLSYIARAADNEDEYNELIDAVARELGMEMSSFKDPTPNSYFYGPLKTAERVAEKAMTDYDGDLSQVGDVLRMTFVVDDPADAMKLFEKLEAIDEPVGLKNRMLNAGPAGYRDVIFKLTLKDGMKAEVQINNRPMLLAKAGKGHTLYKKMRVLPKTDPEYKRLAKESELLYGRAWRRTCLEHPEFPGCPARKDLEEILPEGASLRRTWKDKDGKVQRTFLSREEMNDQWKEALGTDESLDDFLYNIANSIEGVDHIDSMGIAINQVDEVPKVYFSFNLIDAEGKQILFVSREIELLSGGRLRAVHRVMTVDPDYRGAGKEFMRASFIEYEKLGINEVRIPSAVNDGAYAWPRYGFQADAGSWDEVRKPLRAALTGSATDDEYPGFNEPFGFADTPEDLERWFDALPGNVQQEVLAILDNPDPSALQDLAALSQKVTISSDYMTDGESLEVKLGYALLKRQAFSELKLDTEDGEQMARFWRYVDDDDRAEGAIQRAVLQAEKAAKTPDELELPDIEERLAKRKAFDDSPGQHGDDKAYVKWLEEEADDALKDELAPELDEIIERGSTKAMHTDAEGEYTPERKELHEEIINYVMKKIITSEEGTEEVEELTYQMMGGGIAAGKTTSIRSGFVKLPRNHSMIAADDIKNMLPEYQKLLKARRYEGAELVHLESSDITWEIHRRLLAQGTHNIVMDGTADGDLDSMVGTLTRMREAGYRLVVDYSSNPTDLAVFYSKNRAERTGRWVAEGVTRRVHRAVSIRAIEFLERDLFDEMRLWDTEISGKARAILDATRGGTIFVRNREALRRFLDKGGQEARDAWDRILASGRKVEYRGASRKLRKMLAQSEGKDVDDDLLWTGNITRRVEGSRMPAVEAGLDDLIEEVREEFGIELEDYLSGIVRQVDEGHSFKHLDIDIDTADEFPKIEIGLRVVNEDGDKIMDLAREIYRGKDGRLVARHGNFYVDEKYRGIGRDVMHNMVEFYEKIGVRQIEIPFTADVGPYAWARYGFETGPNQWMTWRNKLRRVLLGKGGAEDIDFEGGWADQTKMVRAFQALTDDEKARVLDILSSPDPRAMWQLADLDLVVPDPDGVEDALKLGQVLVARNSYWGARIQLDDPEQMTRFWHYVGNKYRRELAKNQFEHKLDEVLERQGLSYKVGARAAAKFDSEAPGDHPGDEEFLKWMAKEAEGEEREKIQAEVDQWHEPGTKQETQNMHKTPEGEWTPERRELHETILDYMVNTIIEDSDNIDVDELTFHMMGGGPASGKSTGIEAGYYSLPKGHALLNADAIKDWLPEYQQLLKLRSVENAQVVHEESSYLVKEALRRVAAKRKTHMVLDGTGDGSLEGLKKKIEMARKRGYRVVADYNTLPEDLAAKLAKMREAKMGRGVPDPILRGAHRTVTVRAMNALEESLFDEINIWDNEVRGVAKLILESKGKDGKIYVHNRDALTRFLDKAKGREAWDIWERIEESGRVEYVTARQKLETLLKPIRVTDPGGGAVEVEPDIKLSLLKTAKGGAREEDVDLDEMHRAWQNLFGEDQEVEDWMIRIIEDSDDATHINSMTVSIDPNERTGFVHIEYADKDGNKMFDIMRTFNKKADGSVEVDHDALYVDPIARGLGRHIMRNSMEWYEKIGVSKIHIPDATSNGSYAWARYGFTPNQGAWDNVRNKITAVMGPGRISEEPWGAAGDPHITRQILDALSPEDRNRLLTILADPDPKAMWKLADLDLEIDLGALDDPRLTGTTTLGRLLLYRNRWQGDLELEDDEAMARFWKYVNNNYQHDVRKAAMAEKAAKLKAAGPEIPEIVPTPTLPKIPKIDHHGMKSSTAPYRKAFGPVPKKRGQWTFRVTLLDEDGNIRAEQLIEVPGTGQGVEYPSALNAARVRAGQIWGDDESAFLELVDSEIGHERPSTTLLARPAEESRMRPAIRPEKDAVTVEDAVANVAQKAATEVVLPPDMEIAQATSTALAQISRHELLKQVMPAEDLESGQIVFRGMDVYRAAFRERMLDTDLEPDRDDAHKFALQKMTETITQEVDDKVDVYAAKVADEMAEELAPPELWMKAEPEIAELFEGEGGLRSVMRDGLEVMIRDRIRAGKRTTRDDARDWITGSMNANIGQWGTATDSAITNTGMDAALKAAVQSSEVLKRRWKTVPKFATLDEDDQIALRDALKAGMRVWYRDQLRELSKLPREQQGDVNRVLFMSKTRRGSLIKHLGEEFAPDVIYIDDDALKEVVAEVAEQLGDRFGKVLDATWQARAKKYEEWGEKILDAIDGDDLPTFVRLQQAIFDLRDEMDGDLGEIPDELMKPIRVRIANAMAKAYDVKLENLETDELRDLVKAAKLMPDKDANNLSAQEIRNILGAQDRGAQIRFVDTARREAKARAGKEGSAIRKRLLKVLEKTEEERKRNLRKAAENFKRIQEIRDPVVKQVGDWNREINAIRRELSDPNDPFSFDQERVNEIEKKIRGLMKALDENTEYVRLKAANLELMEEEGEAARKAAQKFLLEELKVDNPEAAHRIGVQLSLENGVISEYQSEGIDEAAEFIGSIWHRRAGDYGDVHFYKRKPSLDPDERTASAYLDSGDQVGVHLVPGADKKTAVHELGHWIEDKDPYVHHAIKEFLKRRMGTDRPVHMGSGYHHKEITIPDKFRDRYVGKIYLREDIEITGYTPDKLDDLGGTEVLSMGLQWLYEDAAGFAREDPDMFDFIVNLVLDQLDIGRPSSRSASLAGNPVDGFLSPMGIGRSIAGALKPIPLAVGKIRLVDRIVTLSPPPIWTYTLSPEQRGWVALTEYLVKVGVVTEVAAGGNKWIVDEERLEQEFGLTVEDLS